MKPRWFPYFVAFSLLNASLASAQWIGVFSTQTPNGDGCIIRSLQFVQVTIYVLAIPGGTAAGGIAGAEFQLTGIPSSWFVSGFGPPGGCDPGPCPDPRDGTHVAFPSCQEQCPILLYTLNVVPLTTVSD